MAFELKIDNFDRNYWEQYAKEFIDYSIYQTWPYQQFRGEMAGQKVSRFIIKDQKGQLVTMGQVRIKHIKLLGLKIGYIQWGPLVRAFDGTLKCSIESLKALQKAYIGGMVNILRVAPNVVADEWGLEVEKKLLDAGFNKNEKIKPYRTFNVDVGDSEQGIRQRLKKSFRRDLKNSENTGLEVRVGTEDNLFAILAELYEQSKNRKGFQGLDMDEFRFPQKELSNSEKMKVFVAFWEGKPVSGLLSTELGDLAIVLMAASNRIGLEKGSSYLLWYQACVSAHQRGLKWCDLGGIDPENNPNVYQFKSRMGGSEKYYIGIFDSYQNTFVKTIWETAEKAYLFIKK